MRIITSIPVFNPINNSFVYLCTGDDESLWVRSSAGNWTSIDHPLDTFSVRKDFEAAVKNNAIGTPESLKTENKGDVVVPVIKFVPDTNPVEVIPIEKIS